MKKLERRDIVKRLDKLCQTCARYRGARKRKGEWINNCVSCGAPVLCSKANGGHFVGRACYPLRWDEKNVNCQCVHCNLYKNGAYVEYSQWFIHKFGQDTFDKYVNTYREWQVGNIPTFTMPELRAKHDVWLKKGRELEKKTGLSLFPKSWDFFGEDYLDYDPTD